MNSNTFSFTVTCVPNTAHIQLCVNLEFKKCSAGFFGYVLEVYTRQVLMLILEEGLQVNLVKKLSTEPSNYYPILVTCKFHALCNLLNHHKNSRDFLALNILHFQ